MCGDVCEFSFSAFPPGWRFVDSLVTLRFPSLGPSNPEKWSDLSAAKIPTSDELSDDQLLTGACRGDQHMLALLFARYARIVRGIAYRILRDRSEADDLLQDLFLVIHRSAANFDPSKGSARHWILQMAYRRAISRRRYLHSRHFYSQLELDEISFRLADPRTSVGGENTPDGSLGPGDLQKLLAELSEDQRQALLLRFVDGYTLEEIAQKMGQSRANIKNHYFRGLEKMRRFLFSGKFTVKSAL
jgi:RNA polymerase sigma-70 factor, ECF subfamily